MTSGNNGIRLAALPACVAMLAFTLTAHGAERGAEALEQLMRDMAKTRTASAKFAERRELRMLEKPLELSGTLRYTAPDRLERHTLKPSPESMLLTKDTLTLEDKARGRTRTVPLQQYPLIWAFAESIRSVLAGDLATLRRFYTVDFDGNAARWQLMLHPREPGMRSHINDIRISGAAQMIRTIEVNEAGGDRSVMTISDSVRE